MSKHVIRKVYLLGDLMKKISVPCSCGKKNCPVLKRNLERFLGPFKKQDK